MDSSARLQYPPLLTQILLHFPTFHWCAKGYMSDYVLVSIGGIEQILSLPRLAVRSALTSVGYREAAVPGAFRLCQLILSGAIEWKYRRRTQLYPLTDYAGGLKAAMNKSSSKEDTLEKKKAFFWHLF
ncbi:hypothetical protein Bca101_086510 [Brassica carinata]